MKQFLLFTLVALSAVAKAINPDREYKWTPDMRGLDYSEYQVTTTDNYLINVWEYRLADSAKLRTTMILVGTDAGNMGYLIWQAKVLIKKGIRVIAFDYRGFGRSSDFDINNNFLFYPEFGLDLDSVIKATRDKYPNDAIGLYAMSMGTYVSLLANEKIDFLIAEGFYYNPKKVADRIKINKGETVLLPPHAKTIKKLENNPPVLIFCADSDNTTVTEDAREFSKNNNVTIIEFKGDHLSGMRIMRKTDYGDEYADRIIAFLKKYHM